RRGAPLSWAVSQSKPVVGIEGGLTRDRPKTLAQGPAPHRLIVGLVVEQRELRRRGRLLGHDGFVLGQGGLPTNSAVGGILVGERAGDRPRRSRRIWLQACQSCPVVGLLGWSVAGSAAGSERGRLQNAPLEPGVLIVAGLVRPDRGNPGDQDQLLDRRELHHL